MNTKCKLLIILFVGLTATIPLRAQEERDYLYSQNLEAFAGVWEYAANGEVFRLVLKKGRIDTSYSYGDYLLGGYSYSKNGVMQCDYTQNIPLVYVESFYPQNEPACDGTNYWAEDPEDVDANKLELYVTDYAYDKYGYTIFTLQSPSTAHFKMIDSRWLNGGKKLVGFSIPTDVVMTKIQ